MPMLTTSMLNTAAVRGVPNRAEKRPLMPHMTMMFIFRSLSRHHLPRVAARLPPIWSAAPSRPAEPPVRWVSTEPRKISGARRSGGRLPLRTEAMI